MSIRLSIGRFALLVIVALLVGAAGGIFGFIYFTSGSGEPSMSVEDALATRQAEEALISDAVGTAVAQAANEIIPAALGAAMEAERARQPVAFSIVSDESQASFTVEEDLRGVRTTVVGATSDVAGTINVVLGEPSQSTIGDILISARTLTTDNDMRNRALRSRILFSAQDENEFIVFEPRGPEQFLRRQHRRGRDDSLRHQRRLDRARRDAIRDIRGAGDAGKRAANQRQRGDNRALCRLRLDHPRCAERVLGR